MGVRILRFIKKPPARTVSSAALLALILLSFALRAYRLDGQSLWGDEAWSLFHATRESFGNVLRSARDDGVVPPAYYLFLHAWISAAGRSEFALRYVSLLCGVLATPAIFALGRRLGGVGTGIVAALFQTLSPFHVYYGQETRMYAQMTLFTILSTYFFWRLIAKPPSSAWKVWAGYAITGGLAVNSHYFAWYVILAHGLFWLGDLLWKRCAVWRTALLCLSAQAAILALFLPWTLYVWNRALGLTGQVTPMSVPLAAILRRCLGIFSAGAPSIVAEQAEVGWMTLIPFLLLLALSLLWPWKRRGSIFLVVCASAPILATFFVSFPTLPGWSRYFIAASPPYYLLLAQGADGLRRFAQSGPIAARRRVVRVGLVALLVAPLSLAQMRSLRQYYTDPTHWHWDYRGQINSMADAARTDAAIVYNGGDLPVLLKYYLPDGVPYTIIPSLCNADEGRIRGEIAAVAAEQEQIWLVRSMPLACDHNHRAAQWLKENAYQVSETWLENNLFDLYLTPTEMSFSDNLPALTFGGQFELVEFASSRERAAPGDALAVALRWRALFPIETDYKFFLILLGPNDKTFALKDGMPLNWLRPTTSWSAGEIVDDRWGMAVSADTPIGAYPLYVGAYDPATGERLPVQTPDGESVGDMLLITEIEVR
ncbi:MAG: glycosyltransferase family 39 protein [Chloroflexota bacterium]|nr:glycosyltransferase family 39 protein [Chloroflexota bacterium]